MFEAHFAVQKVSVDTVFENGKPISRVVYRFETERSGRYLIFVKRYDHGFRTIEFCRKSMKLAKTRFTEMTNKNEASRIIGTVFYHMVALLKAGKADRVSFGFIGARMPNEDTRATSKRFRIYRKISANLISPRDYEQLQNDTKGYYLVLNKLSDRQAVMDIASVVYEKQEEE